MNKVKINYFLISLMLYSLSGCCAFVLSDTPDTLPDPDWIVHRVNPKQSMWNKDVSRIIVEIDRIDGTRPYTYSLKTLKETLKCQLKHINNIDIRYDDNISKNEYEHYFEEGEFKAKKFAKKHQSIQPGPNEYLIYLITTSHFSNEYAGLSVYLDSNKTMIVLDKNNIHRYAVLYLSNNSAEARVLTHEIGHALGLCHNPSHCQKINGGHCVNPWCCMYPRDFNWRFVLCNLWPAIIGSAEKDFCHECQEDLKKYDQSSHSLR